MMKVPHPGNDILAEYVRLSSVSNPDDTRTTPRRLEREDEDDSAVNDVANCNNHVGVDAIADAEDSLSSYSTNCGGDDSTSTCSSAARPGAIAIPGVDSARVQRRRPTTQHQQTISSISVDGITIDNLLQDDEGVDDEHDSRNNVTEEEEEEGAAEDTLVEAELVDPQQPHSIIESEEDIPLTLRRKMEHDIREQVQQELLESIPQAEIIHNAHEDRIGIEDYDQYGNGAAVSMTSCPKNDSSASVADLLHASLDRLGSSYGRKAEVATLRTVLDDMTSSTSARNFDNDGDTEAQSHIRSGRSIVMISGEPGSGKTTLAKSLKSITENEKNGMFIMGKYEVNEGHTGEIVGGIESSAVGVPYSAIISATREICQTILQFFRKKQLEELRQSFQQNFHPHELHQLLIPCIPELQDLVAEGGPATITANTNQDDGQMTKVRFLQAFTNLIQLLSNCCSPIVFVIDDLQWCDEPSYELLQHLIQDHRTTHDILFVGTYRSNEVDKTHPLKAFLQKLDVQEEQDSLVVGEGEESTHHLEVVTLNAMNLDVDTITCILREFLKVDTKNNLEMLELAELCRRRTGGNPFFLKQFLRSLIDMRLVTCDKREDGFRWNLQRISTQSTATDNVVAFLKEKIKTVLNPDGMRWLTIAACLGYDFDRATLIVVIRGLDGDYPDTVDKSMNSCIREGLIESTKNDSGPGFHFVHDKIQEACLSVLSDNDQQELRQRIGWTLYHSNLSDANLYLILELLNKRHPEQEEKRLELAKLHLEAAQRTWGMAAFSATESYCKKGLKYLSPDPWTDPKEKCLALQLFTIGAKIAFFRGDDDALEQCTSAVISSSTCSIQEKLRCHDLKATNLGKKSKPGLAMKLSLDLLAQLGWKFPRNEPTLSLRTAFALFRMKQKRNQLYGLNPSTMPMIDNDPTISEKLEIVASANGYAYFSGQMMMFVLTTIHVVNFTIENGISINSPHNFCSLGLIFMHFLDDWDTGCCFVDIGLAMSSRFDVPPAVAEIGMVGHSSVLAWRYPISSRLPFLLEGFEVGSMMGDVECAAYNLGLCLMMQLVCGESLSSVVECCGKYSRKAKDCGNLEASLWVKICYRVAKVLQDGIGIQSFLSEESMLGSELSSDVFQFFRSFLCAYLGLYEDGADIAIKRGDGFVKNMRGMVVTMMDPFVRAVSLHATARRRVDGRKYRMEAQRAQQRVASWAKRGNPNVVHQLKFLKAEELISKRRKASKGMIQVLFKEAIAIATKEGFIHDAALASERFGDYLYGLHQTTEAKTYWEEAVEMYRSWGANYKVTLLREKLGPLLDREKTGSVREKTES